MSIGDAPLGESGHKLMLAIGDAIHKHTMQSPMTPEAIIGISSLILPAHYQ